MDIAFSLLTRSSLMAEINWERSSRCSLSRFGLTFVWSNQRYHAIIESAPVGARNSAQGNWSVPVSCAINGTKKAISGALISLVNWVHSIIVSTNQKTPVGTAFPRCETVPTVREFHLSNHRSLPNDLPPWPWLVVIRSLLQLLSPKLGTIRATLLRLLTERLPVVVLINSQHDNIPP